MGPPWPGSSSSEPSAISTPSLFEASAGPQSLASGAGGLARLKLVLAYDGTEFHGFAVQPNVRTVAGVLNQALEKVLRRPVDVTCAGRTDAGVHAQGQVVSLDGDPATDTVRLGHALNGMLGPEVVVRSVEVVDAGFDARFDARWRSYRYTVLNRPTPDPFLARYGWWMPGALAFGSMQAAADPFVGSHNFASFCRAGPEGTTTEREIYESSWSDLVDGLYRYDISGKAFCWQMVRSLVGTMVDVGLGKRRAGEMTAILRAKDRAKAGQVAPPHGLCLWEVGYD